MENDILGKKARKFLQAGKTAGELQLSKVGIYCATNPKYMALALAATPWRFRLLLIVLSFDNRVLHDNLLNTARYAKAARLFTAFNCCIMLCYHLTIYPGSWLLFFVIPWHLCQHQVSVAILSFVQGIIREAFLHFHCSCAVEVLEIWADRNINQAFCRSSLWKMPCMRWFNFSIFFLVVVGFFLFCFFKFFLKDSVWVFARVWF